MLTAGSIITVTPTELVAGGAALARVDGFPIFVFSIYPGDVARVRVKEVKKGFARAELVELLRPSEYRRLDPCPVAGECGGCDWTALRLDRQLEAKRRILTESLRRVGKLDPGKLPPINMHPSPLNYRLRSRLHRDGDAAGFFALRSNRVVPLPRECEVVGVETARRFGGQVTPPDAAAQGTIATWEVAGEIVVAQTLLSVIGGEEDLTLNAGEYTYRLSTRSFFQVNRHLLGTMLRLVRAHADRVAIRKTAIDLYAGVGFFTVPLALQFDEVIAVEGDEESVRYGGMNVPPNAEMIHAPVERWVQTMPGADLVFLDPPRIGVRHSVIDSVALRAKEMICYLSCDPVTFARDASRLTASGWRLSTLDLLDLFPNTHHVETLSSFERAPTPY